MQNTQSLLLLRDHARNERDEALSALQRCEEAARQAQAQAEQLQNYLGEYQAQHAQRFAAGTGIEMMHAYRSFLQRLDVAIGQQARSVAHARSRAQAARALLLEREKRLAAVDKLIERRQLSHRNDLARREQHRLDEAAQRWRGPSALRGGPPTTY